MTINYINSVNRMTIPNASVWYGFASLIKNIVGGYIVDNYEKLVQQMFLKYFISNIRIKVPFLHAHLDKFSDSISDLSKGKYSARI